MSEYMGEGFQKETCIIETQGYFDPGVDHALLERLDVIQVHVSFTVQEVLCLISQDRQCFSFRASNLDVDSPTMPDPFESATHRSRSVP
jgi:hypothetical protein